MNRNVIHIDVTDFHIAVERVGEPRLRKRPVAVSIETATRSVIVAASTEARQNGVYRGMPLDRAKKNCPDLTVLPPNDDLYWRATSAMINIIGQYTPVVEPLRFGHAYLDMTGMSRLFGRIKDAAFKAQQDIRQRLQLDASAGVASNKLVSKVASDVITDAGERLGLCDVRHGDEEPFLAPLRVGYLPGIRSNVRDELTDLNIRIIRELAAVSSEHLQMVFGRFGVLLHQRAHGIDHRPVQPPKRAPQVVETETLDQDSNDYHLLRAMLYAMLSRAADRLREKQLHTRRLVVELRYSDYKEGGAHQRFQPMDTEIQLAPVLQHVLDSALTRRIRVRKLTLRLCDLSTAPRQMSLFEDKQDPKQEAVTRTMQHIRNRYGDHAIRFGRAA